jgi:hypothetical protein
MSEAAATESTAASPTQKPQQAAPVNFDSIVDALAAIRNGESVVVVDDENRENEGDLICAAQFATPQQINFMATAARGLICLAMEGERLDWLELPLMVNRNTDSNQTAFTGSHDPSGDPSRKPPSRPAPARSHLSPTSPRWRRAQTGRPHRSRCRSGAPFRPLSRRGDL